MLLETPPRAWGRPRRRVPPGGFAGNTPTGVGKTASQDVHKQSFQKHPHGRGEDPDGFKNVYLKPETPPRAWGRLAFVACAFEPERNTPTGVGKTYDDAS